MKNKKIQSILALSLAAAMMLTACGTSESGSGDASTPASSSSEASEEEPSAAEEDSAYDEHVTLTCWSWMDEPELRAQTQFLEEKFNVTLEFQCYSDADGDTQLNLMYESGEYPDIFLGYSFSTAQVQTGADIGALLPLDDYIVEGTSYKEILDLYPEYQDYVTANDGHIYTFMANDQGKHMISRMKMWYREEWMEKLGWETPPSTPEEFKEYLIQIRDTDVNGNGDPNDEIPLVGYVDGTYTDPICYLMNPFELYTGKYYRITDDDEIYFSATTDGWRKGLAYIADLYAEGLIAEETYVQDSSTFKGLVNRVGEEAIVGNFPIWYNGSAIDTDVMSWFTYEALPPLKGDYQQTSAQGASFWLNTAISTSCEHPDRAFAIMDYLLSEEGTYLTFYGIEGEGYEWVDQENFLGTTPAVSQLVDYQNSLKTQHYNHAGVPTLERTGEVRYSIVNDESKYDTSNTWVLVKAAQKYEPYYVNDNIPKIVWASDDVMAEVSEYEVLINEYIEVSDTEFIMGIRDINDDAQWQAYLDELDAMGLQDYIELLYTYYDLK